MTPKKGRARRAKAKEAKKCVTYQLRPEFAHLAVKGGDFHFPDFAKLPPWDGEITLTFRHPPMFHGVIFDYGDKPPCSPTSP